MFNYVSGNELNVPKIVRHVLLGLLLLVLFFGSFGVVGPQERGVRVRLGVMRGVVESGPYFKLPIIERVVKMDVKTQSLEATREAPLSAASNDLQDTRFAVVVNYHVDPSAVANIYQQYGGTDTYYHSVVEPLIVATVKSVASQYTAADQIQKRSEMSARALQTLQSAFEGKSIVIEKADITDVAFSESFTKAIEEKVTAVQQAEAAKNKLEQVKFEKEQRIAQAQGEAEAIRIQAQAITQQGGKEYVSLKWVEKWDGHMPTTMLGEGGMSTIVDLRK